MDPVGEFISAECEVDTTPDAKKVSRVEVRTSAFLEHFNQWAVKQRYRELDVKALKGRMLDKGFLEPHAQDGYPHWRSIRFRARADAPGRYGERDE